MSKSSIQSAADPQSAPERDFLTFRLIGLAETYLDAYFADPAGIEAYQRPSRRVSGRGKAARALANWKRDAVTLTLASLPEAESFQVEPRGAQFNASLRLRYLPEAAKLLAAPPGRSRVSASTGGLVHNPG